MNEAVIIIILIVISVVIAMGIMIPIKNFVLTPMFSSSYTVWKVWRYIMGIFAVIIFAVLVYFASLLNLIKF